MSRKSKAILAKLDAIDEMYRLFVKAQNEDDDDDESYIDLDEDDDGTEDDVDGDGEVTRSDQLLHDLYDIQDEINTKLHGMRKTLASIFQRVSTIRVDLAKGKVLKAIDLDKVDKELEDIQIKMKLLMQMDTMMKDFIAMPIGG